MTIAIDYSLRGLPETQALLEQFTGQKLQNRTKRGLRAGVKVMRQGIRAKARADGRSRGFRNTRTRDHRNPVGISVSPTSPLSNIFEHGADAHTIAPSGKGILSNFESRRQAGPSSHEEFFLARGPVRHPGVAAKPLIVPVFEANEDKALEAVRATLFEGLDR